MAMQLCVAAMQLSVAVLLSIAMQLSVAVLLSVAVFVLAGAAVAVWWVLLQLKQRLGQRVTITKPTQVNEHKASYCLVGLSYRNTWKPKDLV